MKGPRSPICRAASQTVVCGPLLLCKTSEVQDIFCQTAVKRKKLLLKKFTCIPAHASKRSVCACEINSVRVLIGCKLNYYGSLTEHDPRKMRYSFTLKTQFRNSILGNTATLLSICCPGLLPHTHLDRSSPRVLRQRRGALLGSSWAGSHRGVYTHGCASSNPLGGFAFVGFILFHQCRESQDFRTALRENVT